MLEHPAELPIYDNDVVAVRHVEIEADEVGLLERLVGAARATLPLESHDALLRAWQAGARDPLNTLVKIGLSAGEPLSDAALTAITVGIGDPSGAVRCVAAYAAALNGDSRSVPALRTKLDSETDDNARDIM